MGYPPFNLTTLQLVAPTASMTKAEYKDAYGIDLDDVNIKAFKLVLFGGEKYTIDQIKEVEDGIEIYFNGHILSITDNVEVSDEVYNVAHSKPIYLHPIRFKIVGNLGANNPIRVNGGSIMIFNTSDTALDTSSKLRSYLYNAGNSIDILCNVDFYDDQATYKGQLLSVKGGADQFFVTYTVDGVTVASSTLSVGEFEVLSDTLNKIN